MAECDVTVNREVLLVLTVRCFPSNLTGNWQNIICVFVTAVVLYFTRMSGWELSQGRRARSVCRTRFPVIPSIFAPLPKLLPYLPCLFFFVLFRLPELSNL